MRVLGRNGTHSTERVADGRETTFQSVEAVTAAIAVVDAQLKMQARALSGGKRFRTPYYRSGL